MHYRVAERVGGGCRKFVLVLGGEGTEIVPPGDIFDQPLCEMNSTRGKTNHIRDHVVQFPEGAVLVRSPGTE